MISNPSLAPVYLNMRSYLAQRLETRPGELLYMGFTSAAPLHSVRRIQSSIASSLVCGGGTNLYTDSNGSNPLDTGYSGNPLLMVPVRPEQSPDPWMYVGDSLRLSKISASGTVRYNWGVAPPLNPPTIAIGPPAIFIINPLYIVTGWTNGGTAGALATGTRFFSDITAVLYDVGTTGWVSIVPTSPTNALQPGMVIEITQGGTATEYEVQKIVGNAIAASSGNTIAAIAYDSGTAGACSITFTIPITATPSNTGYTNKVSQTSTALTPQAPSNQRIVADTSPGVKRPVAPIQPVRINQLEAREVTQPVGLQRDALLLLNNGGSNAEWVRVLAVTIHPNGQAAIRCVTVNTHAAGEPVQGAVSIRLYVTPTYTTGGVLSAGDITSTLTVGTGTISMVSPFDLGIIGNANLPTQPSDEIHLSIQVANASYLSEVRLIFDVDSSINDFQHSYYFVSWRPQDAQTALAGNSALWQSRASSYAKAISDSAGEATTTADVDYSRRRVGIVPFPIQKRQALGPTSQVLPLGATSPWIELVFKVSELTLVGTDQNASLTNTQGIRIQVTVTNAMQIALSALWIGGGYGPDIGSTGTPYLYEYRGRSVQSGGARSISSPATRQGIDPHSQSVAVSLPFHPDPQVDTLDVYRWGGTLPQWTFVGSVANPSSGTASFLDTLSDAAISSNPLLETDEFQPFPTIGRPQNGVVNVIGSTVNWVSGAQFNTSWAAGTQININGIYYTTYQQPTETITIIIVGGIERVVITTSVQIVENAGTQTNVPYFVTEPTLLGQPLPAVWGPYAQGSALYLFACGDFYQPGVLFLTNGNDPDAASDILQIEITSPSDPLIGGCMYNGQGYVWSANKLFALYPSFGNQYVVASGELLPTEGTNLFIPIEVPNGKGLWCPWAVAVGPKMWFLARDGIYETTGGEPVPITVGPWATLFPHEGQAGSQLQIGNGATAITVNVPNMALLGQLRLSYYDGFLYFDYMDVSENPTTLVYDTNSKNWSLDLYRQPVTYHYGDEGQGKHQIFMAGTDGSLYLMSGTQDKGSPFTATAYMPQMSEQSGGYQHIRDGYMGVYAPNGLTLGIEGDLALYTSTIPAPTTPQYERTYLVGPPLKSKLFEFYATGTSPFSIFMRDCEFRMKTWADSDYKPVNPFSGPARAAQTKVQ